MKVEVAVVPANTGTPDRNPDWRQRGRRLVLNAAHTDQGEIVIYGVLDPDLPEEANALVEDGKVSFVLGRQESKKIALMNSSGRGPRGPFS